MRKTLALLGLISIAAQPIIAASAMAQTGVAASGNVTTTSSRWSQNPARETVLLPVRVVSGAVYTPFGAVNGLGKRAGQYVQYWNSKTLEQVDFKSNPAKSLLIVPVGVAGDAAALGIGAGVGAVEGSIRGFANGFGWPDRAGQ